LLSEIVVVSNNFIITIELQESQAAIPIAAKFSKSNIFLGRQDYPRQSDFGWYC
jgi:hypothetical protein